MQYRLKVLRRALWTLFEDSGFSMAGAVAFSFVLSLFPFCIFLGALAGTIGGRDLAAYAISQLFDAVPDPVAVALAPEVERVMGQSQYGLLTVGAAISLFFATSAIESLRAALNLAYRVKETPLVPLVHRAELIVRFRHGGRHAGDGVGRDRGACPCRQQQVHCCTLAGRSRPVFVQHAIRDRACRHHRAAHGVPCLAGGGPAQRAGGLAGCSPERRALAAGGVALFHAGSASAIIRASMRG